MSDPSSPQQKFKLNVKISHSVLARSSTINTCKMTVSSSRMGLRSASNYIFDTMERIQLRTPALRLDSKTLGYEKLKLTTSHQYFREDWGGVTAIRYLYDGERIAVGFNSGDLQISTPMSTPMRSAPSETILKGWEGNDSVSCIRFHPKKPSVMFASSTAGTVIRRDLEDHTNYNDVFITEKNEIYSMDFTANSELVTVGRDATVRMYDVEKEKGIGEFGRRPSTSTSTFSELDFNDSDYHEKRIYCVRCHPSDPAVLVSGGWDGVRVWDSREGRPVKSIAGPFIFGDTVDLCKNVILTASCEANNCLQLWDLGSGFLIENVNPPNKRVYLYGEYPYVAQFFRGDPSGDLVLYGVGGLQLISVKEMSILYLIEDDRPVAAVDSTEKKIAFGGKSNSVLHCRMIFPETDVVSGTFSMASRTISSKSDQSLESETKKDEEEEKDEDVE